VRGLFEDANLVQLVLHRRRDYRCQLDGVVHGDINALHNREDQRGIAPKFAFRGCHVMQGEHGDDERDYDAKREAKNKYPVKWWAQYVRDLDDLSDAVESGGTERPHGRKKTYFAYVPHADPASCREFALELIKYLQTF
jgi:hypothetical protein